MRLRFNGPPGPKGPHFVEAEDNEGRSVSFGRWEADAASGDWFLVLDVEEPLAEIDRVLFAIRGDWTDPRAWCDEGREAAKKIYAEMGLVEEAS